MDRPTDEVTRRIATINAHHKLYDKAKPMKKRKDIPNIEPSYRYVARHIVIVVQRRFSQQRCGHSRLVIRSAVDVAVAMVEE